MMFVSRESIKVVAAALRKEVDNDNLIEGLAMLGTMTVCAMYAWTSGDKEATVRVMADVIDQTYAQIETQGLNLNKKNFYAWAAGEDENP